MASKKDLTLNTPTKKTELTKANMLDYVKKNGTVEDKKWFYDLMKDNIIKKKNNLTKEVVDGYDLPKIREAFAQKYFPELSSKNKKNSKAKKKSLSFEEELEALLK